MSSSAKLVVVMGTQYYDGSGLGASDYPVTDLLQMLGRASRPGIDEVRAVAFSVGLRFVLEVYHTKYASAVDYSVNDLLQMLGRASRPGIDEVRAVAFSVGLLFVLGPHVCE
jgi:replicative superfamily II helicase